MRSRGRKYYLVNLYKQNKVLFLVLVLLSLLHLNANFFVGGQQSPFFQWHIYANPIVDQDTFTIFEFRYNDDQVVKFRHTWQQPQELIIYNPLQQYVYMKENGGQDALKDYIDNWESAHPFTSKLFPGLKLYPDSTEMDRFPEWGIRKIGQYTGDIVHNAAVYKVFLRFDRHYGVEKIGEEMIQKIK